VTVPLEQAPSVQLRQPTETLDLDQLGRPLELGEVLLDRGVGKPGQHV
jgi:hypothetical protein